MWATRAEMHAVSQDMSKAVTDLLANTTGQYPIVERMNSKVGRSNEFFDQFVSGALSRLEKRLREPGHNVETCVPRLWHRVWVTDPAAPILPERAYLDLLLDSFRLGAGCYWTNCFWSNSPEVLEVISSEAAARGLDVSLYSLNCLGIGSHLQTVDRLIKDKKYVLACDVLRICVLNRFGGLYTDIGVSVSSPFLSVVEVSRYTLLLGESRFFQTSLLAAAAKSDLTELMMANISAPEAMFPDVIRASRTTLSSIDEVNIFAGPTLTNLALLFLSEEADVFICARSSPHLGWIAQRSWYGTPKYGNAKVEEAEPSIIEIEKYTKYTNTISENVTSYFGENGLSCMLSLLIGWREYFLLNPTPLCREMYSRGTDKALHWHNYSFIYYYLFRRKVGVGARLLEIGKLSDQRDGQSAAEQSDKLSASVRAWQAYFKNATIFAANAAPSSLFSCNRVSYHVAGQTEKYTLKELWGLIGDNVDIAIDDGLHKFKENLDFTRGSMDHLTEDGLLIIEDVASQEVDSWKKMLGERQISGLIVNVPYEKNSRDNCLVIIPGRAHQLCQH